MPDAVALTVVVFICLPKTVGLAESETDGGVVKLTVPDAQDGTPEPHQAYTNAV
ncbi:MAG: hypothetical protein QXL94_08935 [Candidatus Parvarchaeum sp.]